MQNKPNLQENQVNANSVLAKGYEDDIVFWPKNPKPNFLNGKMNISYAITTDYENARLRGREKAKPNSKPIKPNFPTPCDETNPIQTQSRRSGTQYEIRDTQYSIRDTNPSPPETQFTPMPNGGHLFLASAATLNIMWELNTRQLIKICMLCSFTKTGCGGACG